MILVAAVTPSVLQTDANPAGPPKAVDTLNPDLLAFIQS